MNDKMESWNLCISTLWTIIDNNEGSIEWASVKELRADETLCRWIYHSTALQHGFLGLSAKDNNNDLYKLYSTEGNTLVYFMSLLEEAQQGPLQLTTTIREDNSAWPIYVIENESVITEL